MPASKLQPALLGGLFIGVLSALPIISAGNCICCMWIIGGGVIAAYLLQQNQTAPISASDGAVTGLLAGLVGALVSFIISIPVGLIFGPMQAAWMERVSSSAGEIPPELRSLLESMQQQSGAFSIIGALVGFVFFLFLGVIFGSLGGLLGALFFKKDGPPPPTPPIPQNPFGGAPFNPPPLGPPSAPPTA